jgi:RNA polymerase primary sigma factor
MTRTASAMDMYLAEIGCYPLLSVQEEVELAIQHERGHTAERQLAEMSFPDIGEQRQCEQDVTCGVHARQRLIECNLRLVVHLAKRFQGCGLAFSDLVQEGNIGLIEAVERFDYRRGVRFASYAGWWIEKSMRRAVREARAIRLPPEINDELYRLRRAREALESRLGRPPAVQELAEQINASVHRVRRLVDWNQEPLSLEMPVGDTENSPLADLIPDHDMPPVEGFVLHQLRRKDVREAIVTHLEPRDREIVHMRFGLDGGEERTQEEVAQVYGITRERVRQLEKRALQRLRHTSELYGHRAT